MEIQHKKDYCKDLYDKGCSNIISHHNHFFNQRRPWAVLWLSYKKTANTA